MWLIDWSLNEYIISGLSAQVGVSLRRGEPPQSDILIQQLRPQRKTGTRTLSHSILPEAALLEP